MKLEAEEKYQSYCIGWRDAACQRMSSREFEQNEKAHIREGYKQGYTDGYNARRAAFKKAEKMTGHKPTILRVV